MHVKLFHPCFDFDTVIGEVILVFDGKAEVADRSIVDNPKIFSFARRALKHGGFAFVVDRLVSLSFSSCSAVSSP